MRIAAAALLSIALMPSLALARQDSDEQRERRDEYSPITSAGRAAWVAGETVSPGALGGAAFASARTTAANSPREWDNGMSGYGRRFADAQAATAISKSIEAGLGSLWGEDPRYFRSGKTGRWARVRHAMTSVAFTRRRDGHLAPAWGRFAGSIAGNAIENSWLPPSAATRGKMSARIATGFAGQFALNVWAEFWPELRQRLPRIAPHQ